MFSSLFVFSTVTSATEKRKKQDFQAISRKILIKIISDKQLLKIEIIEVYCMNLKKLKTLLKQKLGEVDFTPLKPR